MSKNQFRGQILPLSVSQNFLTSSALIRRLIGKTSIARGDHVLEIGAGKGHITRELAKSCRRVTAYELDPALCAHLKRSLEPNINLICADFLRAGLPARGAYKVFANIPFCISTRILQKLTEYANPPEEMWLIMERGCAMRFCGLPSESAASLRIKPYFEAKIVHRLSRSDFHPMPSVDIVMLHLKRKQQPDLPACQRGQFVGFISQCKTSGLQSRLTKRQISAALRSEGLPDIPQSGEILYIQWLCLFRCSRMFRG